MFHQIMISKTYVIVKQFFGKMILFDIIKRRGKKNGVSYFLKKDDFKNELFFVYQVKYIFL